MSTDKEKREELLKKIKSSIKQKNENEIELITKDNLTHTIQQNSELKRDEILENIKSITNKKDKLNKIKNSKSLSEFFKNEIRNEKANNATNKRKFQRKNIDLGNVYNKK